MEGFFAHQRVICLLDVDCFYVQVARKLNPALVGKPTVVCQYGNRDIILSSSYEARKLGVKKGFRLAEARQVCPEVQVSRIPQYPDIELANLEYHYDQSAKIFETIAAFCGEDALIERASVDECYIDLSVVTHRVITSQLFRNVLESETPPEIFRNAFIYPKVPLAENLTDVIGNKSELNMHLLVGTFIAVQLCQKIQSYTGYTCSAGIAMTKMLAKVVCGMNKPNAYTILPVDKIDELVYSTSLKEFRGLGGIWGDQIIDRLKVKNLGDIQSVQDEILKQHFPYCSEKLRQLSYGFEDDPVVHRLNCKQLSLSKQNTNLSKEELWDFAEKMAKIFVNKCLADKNKYNRIGKKLEVSVEFEGKRRTKTLTIPGSYGHGEPIKTFHGLLKKYFTELYGKEKIDDWVTPITHIGLSVSGFEPVLTDVSFISDYFKVAVEDMDVRPIPRPEPVYQRLVEPTKDKKVLKKGKKNKKQKEKTQKEGKPPTVADFLKKRPLKSNAVGDVDVIDLDSEDDDDVLVEEDEVQVLEDKQETLKKTDVQSTGLEKWLKKVAPVISSFDDDIQILEVECARGDDSPPPRVSRPKRPMNVAIDVFKACNSRKNLLKQLDATSLENLMDPDHEDPIISDLPINDISFDSDGENAPYHNSRKQDYHGRLRNPSTSKSSDSCGFDVEAEFGPPPEPLRDLDLNLGYNTPASSPSPISFGCGRPQKDRSKKKKKRKRKNNGMGLPDKLEKISPTTWSAMPSPIRSEIIYIYTGDDRATQRTPKKRKETPEKEEPFKYSLFEDKNQEYYAMLRGRKVRRVQFSPTGLGTSKGCNTVNENERQC